MKGVMLPFEYHKTLYHGCQIGCGGDFQQVLWEAVVRTPERGPRRCDFCGFLLLRPPERRAGSAEPFGASRKGIRDAQEARRWTRRPWQAVAIIA
jgi:hypothetical protein